MFCKTILEIISPLPLPFAGLITTTMSTSVPGMMNPETPTTSLTFTVIAR